MNQRAYHVIQVLSMHQTEYQRATVSFPVILGYVWWIVDPHKTRNDRGKAVRSQAPLVPYLDEKGITDGIMAELL